jgi:hypothetical protein
LVATLFCAPAAATHQPDTTSVRTIVRRIVHRTSFTERGRLGIPIPFDASHRPNRASRSPGREGYVPRPLPFEARASGR